MDIYPAITLAIAVLGAALGILNTWKAIDRDRIRLRVTPKIYIGGGNGTVLTGSEFPEQKTFLAQQYPVLSECGHNFCIEIVNVGFVPVVVSDTGFLMRKTKERACIRKRIFHDGGSWPRRLEARESVTVYIPPDPKGNVIITGLRCAYASTDCGLTFKGSSKAFKEVVRRAGKKRVNHVSEPVANNTPETS